MLAQDLATTFSINTKGWKLNGPITRRDTQQQAPPLN